MQRRYRVVASCSALALCTLLSQQALAQCPDGCCGGGRQSAQSPATFAHEGNPYNGGRYGSPDAYRSGFPDDGGGHRPTGNGRCSCGQSHARQPSGPAASWLGAPSSGPAWGPPPNRRDARMMPPPQAFGHVRDGYGPMGPPPRGYGIPPRPTPGLRGW
jgi:hypothetical protein